MQLDDRLQPVGLQIVAMDHHLRYLLRPPHGPERLGDGAADVVDQILNTVLAEQVERRWPRYLTAFASSDLLPRHRRSDVAGGAWQRATHLRDRAPTPGALGQG